MHAIRAPDPSPRRMNSRTCCMSARRYPPVGGCSHGAALTKLLPPSYVKNCVRSLQTAGALPYLPHDSSGAPSATGPLNALSLSSTADEVASGPASLIALIVVSIVPNETMTHGSGAVLTPYCWVTFM